MTASPERPRLGDETASRRPGDPLTVDGLLAARDQDDLGWARALGESLGDLEAVEVRKPDIEHNDLGAKLPHRVYCPCAIGDRADHPESLIFEQDSRRLPEAGVVIHDQHGATHRAIVADGTGSAIVANPSPTLESRDVGTARADDRPAGGREQQRRARGPRLLRS